MAEPKQVTIGELPIEARCDKCRAGYVYAGRSRVCQISYNRDGKICGGTIIDEPPPAYKGAT